MTTDKATPPTDAQYLRDYLEQEGQHVIDSKAYALIVAAVNAYDAHRALAAAVWNAIEDFDSGNWHASTVVSQLRTALAAVEQAEKATP